MRSDTGGPPGIHITSAERGLRGLTVAFTSCISGNLRKKRHVLPLGLRRCPRDWDFQTVRVRNLHRDALGGSGKRHWWVIASYFPNAISLNARLKRPVDRDPTMYNNRALGVLQLVDWERRMHKSVTFGKPETTRELTKPQMQCRGIGKL